MHFRKTIAHHNTDTEQKIGSYITTKYIHQQSMNYAADFKLASQIVAVAS